MTLRSLPGERPALSDPVVFDVRLPPGAGPGPAVDRPALREAGRISSPAFRIGVAVPSATWIPGRTRRPVPGVGGLWIGDGQSDTQGDKVRWGQPLHSGGPTVAFRGANRCINTRFDQ